MQKTHTESSAALACLFAALCCAGAYISIPIPLGPVPLALSNLFAVLGGLLLGPAWGSAAALLYVLLGALGFPVFSGGRGGLAHLVGPTGGYLVGYIAGAFVAGVFSRHRGFLSSVLGSALGFATVLVVGALGLSLLGSLSLSQALMAGLLPFLPGDCVKAILVALMAKKLGPFVDSLRGRRSSRD